jgi:hypothetical protein
MRYQRNELLVCMCLQTGTQGFTRECVLWVRGHAVFACG